MLGGFDFAVLCICISSDLILGALFHSSFIMRLQAAAYYHICIASYLASRQIMWHNKRIHDNDLQITSCNYKLLSWQNILNSGQIAADTEKKFANQGKVLRGGTSRI